MTLEVPAWCVLTLAWLSSAGGAPSCERGRTWWHRERGTCLPCTVCDPALHQVVQLPCDLHRDTVCHSLYQIQIFPELSDDYYDYQYSEVKDSEPQWEVETSTLALAASGCVVFFVVVIVLSIYHAKQWRTLKKALKSDVKDLSAKLKLMESGTEPPAERVVPTDHHIYCNIHVTKDTFRSQPIGKNGPFNVYTQEKH